MLRNKKIMALVLAAAISIAMASQQSGNVFTVHASESSPYDSGYDHGCDDAGRSESDKYINQPEKGPSFHTEEFMSGYYDGLNGCRGGGSNGQDSDGGNDGGGNQNGGLEEDIRNACINTLNFSPDRCDDLIQQGKLFIICNLLRSAGLPLPC